MKSYVPRLLIYVAGVLSGLVFSILVAVFIFVKVPSWLVVEGDAQKADIAVVLGGGGGSRLRAGISLYDAGLVDQLLLVDRSKRDWLYIENKLCSECKTEGKDVVYLEGSRNTLTDASLVHEYTRSHNIDSLLVVTDPYHTRRALLIFGSQFKGSGVEVSVMSSGDYVKNVKPDENWWLDERTSRVIWDEASKIAAFYLQRARFRFKADDTEMAAGIFRQSGADY